MSQTISAPAIDSKSSPQSNTNPALKLNIPWMSGSDIRRSFLDFFKNKDHVIVPSAPVVPNDDPTLLFTNAGMNQFKSCFLGDNRLGYKRAADSQKCIRVSGKHNDLDEVGRDTYHHTLFEMLGNWSFGDYYKTEAITWAWELLTKVWKLPEDRLFVTVYKDDEEAAQIWEKNIGIPKERILPFGDKQNFWEMGEVGPCGPCSEIHFDMGDPATQAQTFAHPVKGVNGENARYIEIWNLVFIQYERQQNGTLKPLKDKHVDTGMGFERIASIIQGSGSNYETDLFRPLLDTIAELSQVPYTPGEDGTPHRVIADHIRALSFAIADGALPGNEGRGYVLRRILRRASRFARNLGQKEAFLCNIVPTLAKIMGDAYSEILSRQDYIMQVIRSEEERFVKTLGLGLDRFAKIAESALAKGSKQIAGTDLFLLYDTYGFPSDLTRILAEEKGMSVDEAGYEKAMEEQRERARGATKFDASLASEEFWTLLDGSSSVDTEFVGYDTLECESKVRRFREHEGEWLLVLDKSPFYPESGGQVGDTGSLENAKIRFEVLDTVKLLEMTVVRAKLLRGTPNADSLVNLRAAVNKLRREAIVRNHSATHLLQRALQQVLGKHVQQQGSKVASEFLRFDFTHPNALTEKELQAVEDIVNTEIQKDLVISISHKAIDEAKAEGAMALFGEKYGDVVRIIRMGEFSLELCGGTHATATGQLGLFRILSESSVASGVRRIEAITGLGALEKVREQSQTLTGIAKVLKAKPGQELQKVEEMTTRLRQMEKELEVLKAQQAALKADELLSQYAEQIGGHPCLILKLDSQVFSREGLSGLADRLSTKLDSGLAVLTHVSDGNLSILALVGKELQGKIKAGDLVRDLGKLADGKGGGRPDRAQAGSKSPEKEELVLQEARRIITQSVTQSLQA